MTYFGFLLRFLVLPILLLAALTYWDARRGKRLPVSLQSLPPVPLVALLAFVAVAYTTPWDNYLVATGVWWYDPALVTGITFGWVPLEEYTFFVLQTVMTSLWVLFLMRRMGEKAAFVARSDIRKIAATAVSIVWMGSILLLSGWKPGNYLTLELAWALPPIALQLAVGADILWYYRKMVITGIASASLYLYTADALAIHSGTWTINPELTLGLSIGGVLPIEEAVFFLVTNMLLVFGFILGLAAESHVRLRIFYRNLMTFRDSNQSFGDDA